MEIKIVFIATDLLSCRIFVMKNVTVYDMRTNLKRAFVNLWNVNMLNLWICNMLSAKCAVSYEQFYIRRA